MENVTKPKRLAIKPTSLPSYMNEPDYFVLMDTLVKIGMQQSSPMPIEAWIADKYQGDFDGLLNHLTVPKQYHYLIRRINGLFDSGDFTGQATSILIPGGRLGNMATFEQAITLYRSKKET